MTKKNQFRQRIRQALLERRDLYCILQTLQQRPLQFSQIKRLLNIKPARLELLLKTLCKWMWIIPRAVPNKATVKFYELHKEQWILARGGPPKNCKILVVYELTKLGTSVLRTHAK